MLHENTIKIVKSTAPILQEHGETLTRHFYKRMFTNNPEVLPYFNHSNQAGGTQQKALAGAIVAYAMHIDNLGALGKAVELIAHKHASLQIKPEHYPIVGENLLGSIREVLGEGATDEVINAWAEAYGFLADILQNRESQIYNENSSKEGGWEGFRKLKVIRKEKESSIITSFYLKREDNQPLPAFKAGQYITVRFPTKDGITTMRNYSLSDKPGLDYFRISVKREEGVQGQTPEGYISNKLHNEIQVGDSIEVAPPCGDFYYDPETQGRTRPMLLLAGGVGITPTLSILRTALQDNPARQIIFVHACQNPTVQAFSYTLENLANDYENLKVYFRYDQPVDTANVPHASIGYADGEFLESILETKDCEYFFCGPKPFMANLYHLLQDWEIPEEQIHFEFFGPRQELERPVTA